MNAPFNINEVATQDVISSLANTINTCTITPEHQSLFLSASVFYKFFAGKNVITKDDLIIISSFVYSWMPTMLHFRSDKFEKCYGLLNKAKAGEDLNKAELTTLKSLINNSIVGTSKLLHFINPEVYPIWDSKVARCFGVGAQSVNNYMLYREWCKNVLAVDSDKAMLQAMQNKLQERKINHDNITHIRALEFSLYLHVE